MENTAKTLENIKTAKEEKSVDNYIEMLDNKISEVNEMIKGHPKNFMIKALVVENQIEVHLIRHIGKREEIPEAPKAKK